VISPLLANVALGELDRLWEAHCRRLGHLVRYADDFVILCRTEAEAREALRRAERILARLGLRLHPNKTRVVDVRDGQRGFDFLGFHHRKVSSWRWQGNRYLQSRPSRRAMQAIRDRVKAITAPRHRLAEPRATIVADVNAVLRGWGAYFRVGNASRQFAQIDYSVGERLGLWLRKKTGGSRGWEAGHREACLRTLGLHHLRGTMAWTTAAPTAAR